MHRDLSNPYVIGPEEIRMRSSDTSGQIIKARQGKNGGERLHSSARN